MNYDPWKVESVIRDTFPDKIIGYDVQVSIEPKNVHEFVELVSINLGHFYSRNHGSNWKLDKVKEMEESGLVFVSIWDHDQLVGFISFVDTIDDDIRVLYLYEIQINPNHQGKSLGKLFINYFHDLAKYLSKINNKIYSNYNNNNPHDYLDRTETLKGTKLTVFSDNSVLDWYIKLGYDKSEDSPQDRKLRSGKVIKPEYYLLFRSADNE
ncbi:Histone-specific N-acetyltransferase NAT4 [Wickerhamomyces ciferrii]|uniref:N-alpha-acetyltransferase 40 n=1 Tax=Wickerhamomyces ciferrii (strain ATCC 14091 / BCRC 22168 / CBS 111 / JCM 3599 / NBRC 0793 / NRRL Y-1031 F-60-10) TaxID=1206466 RepID=K0KHT7_WICCF|nr:Histone-specific N-acetyltransferase NAT4 [Wickerhamomyces ciferrii]CCH40723.1 Histone-specific N-acetyltransferase NAT4 [Wickerhamomyces ciferrii]